MHSSNRRIDAYRSNESPKSIKNEISFGANLYSDSMGSKKATLNCRRMRARRG